ncbi:MAG TPA: hypothetical protein VGJ57_01570, partial [Nitrospirales bacterium]
GLDALGSFSGTRSRAVVLALNTVQLNTAVLAFAQIKTTPQKSPYLTVPAPAAPKTSFPIIAAPKAAPPTESTDTSASGNWVTWNYVAMHNPEIMAQALADIQTNKQPRTAVAGLASEAELNDMLKTNWSAEVSRLNALASATQAGVTPRGLPGGLSLTDKVTAVTPQNSSVTAILKSLPVPLPTKNLGSVWAGQRATAVVFITAPADGYVEGRFNLNATNRHFRIVNAIAYTGELIRGQALAVSLTIPGGQYQDAVPDPANPPALISKAGFVAILAKKGQRIGFTVAFEPVALGMTPVGDNEATLQLSGATSSEVNILSSAPAPTWTRTALIRARFEGINFGVLGAIDDTAIMLFSDGTPCDRVTMVPVPASMTFFNAEQQARNVSVTGESLASGLVVQPFNVTLGPGERKQVNIPLQRTGCLPLGSEQFGTIKYSYAGVVRRADFSVTIYPRDYHWANPSGKVGSCEYSWDIFIGFDGTTSFAYTLDNRNLISEMQLDLTFYVLGTKIGQGVLSDGQNTVHTKRNGYTSHSSFVRDNFVRLLSASAQAGLRCHTPGF